METTTILPEEPSICIPRVDMWVTDDYIRKIFNEVFFGRKKNNINDIENDIENNFIMGIDLIPKTNEKGENYKRVFIHFKDWNIIQSDAANLVRKKLLNGDNIKIMHNNPNYWKCSASRIKRPDWLSSILNKPNDNDRPKPFIIDEDGSDSSISYSSDDNDNDISNNIIDMSNVDINKNNEIKDKDKDKDKSNKTIKKHIMNFNYKNSSRKKKCIPKIFPKPINSKAPPDSYWDATIGKWIKNN